MHVSSDQVTIRVSFCTLLFHIMSVSSAVIFVRSVGLLSLTHHGDGANVDLSLR